MNTLRRLKRFCGYIAGFVFFISGILKLMDPVGAGLVMKEYYRFLHLDFLVFSSKVMGTAFAFAETVVGAGLITGVWRRFIGTCALAMQGFFTLLTLALFIFNPEMDCGCFGEAIHLTHGETLVKNLFLMGLLTAYVIPYRDLGTNRKRKYVSFALVMLSTACFMAYSWARIPLVDFTDFKPGAMLQSSAGVDAGNMYESVFTYEKDGVQVEFSLENLPDSSWTFVSVQTRLKNENTEIPATLSFYASSSGEYMDELAADGKVMIITVYDTQISDKKWESIRRFTCRSEEVGFTTLLLAASTDDIPEGLVTETYISDYKTLISLNRSNAGATYFCDGELIRKWASSDLPDVAELQDIYRSDKTEIAMDQDNKGSLGFQGFLLYVFAVMLLL